jgi:ABC-type glutathione transport system ATPase component
MKTSASSLLQIENLSIMMADRTGPVTIIDDLSLTIKPNEIIGLAGESGCGKSTLAISRPVISGIKGAISSICRPQKCRLSAGGRRRWSFKMP